MIIFSDLKRKGDMDMPFIDSKITGVVSKEKKEVIKKRLGEAASIFLGKSEGFLMAGFQDQYDLYMGGNELEKGAFISVSLFGSASSDAYNQMTEAICKIYKEELDIPGDKIYVSYMSTKDWGWNGRNF